MIKKIKKAGLGLSLSVIMIILALHYAGYMTEKMYMVYLLLAIGFFSSFTLVE